MLTLYAVNVIIVCMTIFNIDIQSGGSPIYRQLADAIEQAIVTGRLEPGERLPTHRELADMLAVNVTTVTRGYKEAERRGLVAGTVGRGTYVSSDVGTDTPMVSFEPYAPGMIELGLINPLCHLDPDLSAGLKKMCRRRDTAHLMQYSKPGGVVEHRVAGAIWANRFGLDVTAENIVVCSGAQHALTCAFGGLFRPGDSIATDSLTYPGVKTLSSMLGLRLVPVEMDQAGMDTGSLDRICRRQKIKGVYLMPGVHNPTTATLSMSRRQELAKVAKQHGLLIVEDDAYDLTRPGIIPPISSLLPEQSVYIAGISKVLAAGLRVAFMVVPRKYRRPICEAVLNTVWMTPPLNVELVSMWIKDGTATGIIEQKRKEAAKRFALAARILHGYCFQGIPTGFFIWLVLPLQWSGYTFEQRMRQLGVNVFSGEKFAVGDAQPPAAARISLTGPKSSDQLVEGLQLIRRVLAGPPPSDDPVTM